MAFLWYNVRNECKVYLNYIYFWETMRVAVVGSRTISEIELSCYLPKETTEIISGGAKGVDTIAALYAQEHKIRLTVFLPEYQKFESAGTRHVIDLCEKTKTPYSVIICKKA